MGGLEVIMGGLEVIGGRFRGSFRLWVGGLEVISLCMKKNGGYEAIFFIKIAKVGGLEVKWAT